MFSLVYRSTASSNLTLSDLKNIHSAAISFNKKNSITGCLLHHDGKFVQLLEGPLHRVLELYQKIEKDKRHTKVKILNTQNSKFRMFKQWSMIFHNLDHETTKEASHIINCFELIYHSSDARYIPNLPKLELWRAAFKIFNTTPKTNLKPTA